MARCIAMVQLCCVQLSNSRTVLYETVQWLDSAVSKPNFKIVLQLGGFCWTVCDWKSYSFGQFQTFCTPGYNGAISFVGANSQSFLPPSLRPGKEKTLGQKQAVPDCQYILDCTISIYYYKRRSKLS